MKLQSYLWFLSRPPMPVLLMVSLMAWLVLLLGGQHGTMHGGGNPEVNHQLHHDVDTMVMMASYGSVANILDPATVVSWIIMIVAMMFPLLSDAIRQIWDQSFSRLRLTGAILFLLGYLSLWVIAGVFMLWITKILQHNFSFWETLAAVVITTVLWQSSPWKQLSLNRCHLVHRINPFGARYFITCFHYGCRKGIWCVASCWALMLVPMVAGAAAILLMFAVGLVMFFEQLQNPRPNPNNS